MSTIGPFRLRIVASLLFAALSLPCAAIASAQAASVATGHLILVLPFENRSGQAALNWIGDSFPVTLDQRLNSAGFLTITRDDRQYALDHLGLPVDFRPTRATTIRIAQTLDANYVIVGNYNVVQGRIAVQAQVLDVGRLGLSAPLEDSAELARLFDIENAIAWKVARQIDPHFPVAEQTFLAASGAIRLSAFENYIRGTDATSSLERIRHLQAAVADAPAYSAALLALGKAQYSAKQFGDAAATLSKVPTNSRLVLEANFYLGLAYFNSAKYANAEAAFAFVASRLPLPEVVNDQAVAASRQGKDAVPLFERVLTIDPNDADYHYNLAVAQLHRGDAADALTQLDLALKLHPPTTEIASPDQSPADTAESEVVKLRSRVAASIHLTGTPLTDAISADGFAPLERIRRTYSEASFRQAAFQLDQMRAARMAVLPPAKQAAEYTRLGHDYLAQGLVPEAEREFQNALVAQPGSAAARSGLAQVREQSGSPDQARAEASASLKITPSADAYMVLARLDLKQNDLPAAAQDVAHALKLDATNSAALGMRSALQARGQSLP